MTASSVASPRFTFGRSRTAANRIQGGHTAPVNSNRPDRVTPAHPGNVEAEAMNAMLRSKEEGEPLMLNLISRDWWVFALRGIAAILFGILAFAQPGITLATLVILFGAYALVDGVALLIALARGEKDARRHAWSVGIMGVIGIGAAIVTFVWPGITALILLYVVAMWAITMGVFQVVSAIALRREIEGEFWMGLGGVVSVLFGILLVVSPGTGLITLVWLVGFWAMAFGASSLGLAYRLHGIAAAQPKPAPAT
jgi:uncharacterized membrane protein HdeD (DUF308 family)